jgi:hypothetical protein
MSIENDILGKRSMDFLLALQYNLSDLPSSSNLDDVEGELDRRYIEFPKSGLSIVLDGDGTAYCLQLYSENAEPDEYDKYTGPLIGGITFESHREDARRIFGVPIRSIEGGLGTGLMGGEGLPWDLFRTEQWDVNITYGEDLNSINFVSISLHDDRIAFGDSAVN